MNWMEKLEGKTFRARIKIKGGEILVYPEIPNEEVPSDNTDELWSEMRHSVTMVEEIEGPCSCGKAHC